MAPQSLLRWRRDQFERQACRMPSRVDTGVDLQRRAPALHHDPPFCLIARLPLRVEMIETPGLRLVMPQRDARRPQDPQTACPQPERKIDVAVSNRQIELVEPPARG